MKIWLHYMRHKKINFKENTTISENTIISKNMVFSKTRHFQKTSNFFQRTEGQKGIKHHDMVSLRTNENHETAL